MNQQNPVNNESGLALLMTVFVIALATILVMDMVTAARFEQRAQRSFVESLQADYVLKSSINLGRALIEMPKLDGVSEDWLGEPWALIGSAPALPISGFAGEPRMTIIDENSKIDINAIASALGSQNPFESLTQNQPENPQVISNEDFWKNALRELFSRAGFQNESYEENSYRTPGNIGYAASQQVAVIHDWIDKDTNSYRSTLFDGEGIESSLGKEWFYNRQLRNIAELVLVPGMTQERFVRVAPFIRVSGASAVPSRGINVNTAPLEVLLSLGVPEEQAVELIQERANLPINQGILQTLTAGDAQLQRFSTVRSSGFTVIARVVMPNTTRWMKANVSVQGSVNNRTTRIDSVEVY